VKLRPLHKPFAKPKRTQKQQHNHLHPPPPKPNQVRLLRTSRGDPLKSAGPGHHAVVAGLRGLPSAGDELSVASSEARAHAIGAARAARAADYRRAQLARARLAAAAAQREAAEQDNAK
jgi:hypothetical protein